MPYIQNIVLLTLEQGPKLGYMYTQLYICRYEGVHLKLAVEQKEKYVYILFISKCLYIHR